MPLRLERSPLISWFCMKKRVLSCLHSLWLCLKLSAPQLLQVFEISGDTPAYPEGQVLQSPQREQKHRVKDQEDRQKKRAWENVGGSKA